LSVSKRQEASLRYFLGSELQKAKIIDAIWKKYNKANHDTYGTTRNSILSPKNDSDWVKNKDTYNIKYDIDPNFGVIKNVTITLKINISEEQEKVVYTLNDNFKRTPRATSKPALKGLKAWALRKITEPQSVESKGKTYWYPAYKRIDSIAWRVGTMINFNKKIKNRSGFLKPFQRKGGKVDNAVDRAVGRFLKGTWNRDLSVDVFNKVDKIIDSI
jgi:hypothetical protein